MSDETLKQYDHLLRDDDVAAIVVRERLRPVQGARGVFFPPTFAAIGQGRRSDYHIDRIGPQADDPEGAQRDGILANRCTVDSVPSQGNRLEGRLLRYSGTWVPKVTISGSRVGKRPLDLLEVGHRVADAAVRYTANNGYKQFEKALRAYVDGDAGPITRLAPTSLVFGHWDSRDTGATKSTKSKARRLIRSEIVAYNVARATKRSQYWSSIDPEVNEELGQILIEAKEAASQNPDTKNPASQLGMTDVPAPESPGGVIAFGPIERTTIIALSGLRALATFGREATQESGEALQPSAPDQDQTLVLRRYLFALALASAADSSVWDLREGCVLVRVGKEENGRRVSSPDDLTAMLVMHTGEEKPFTMPTAKEPEKYLEAAAKAFFAGTVPDPVSLTFDPSGAHAAVKSKSGGSSGEPTTKKDLIAALVGTPSYAGKDAELNKKKKTELQKLWRDAQSGNDAPSDKDGDADTSGS